MSSCNVTYFNASNLFFSQIVNVKSPICNVLREKSAEKNVLNALTSYSSADFKFTNIDEWMDKFLYHDDYETTNDFRGRSQ